MNFEGYLMEIQKAISDEMETPAQRRGVNLRYVLRRELRKVYDEGLQQGYGEGARDAADAYAVREEVRTAAISAAAGN